MPIEALTTSDICPRVPPRIGECPSSGTASSTPYGDQKTHALDPRTSLPSRTPAWFVVSSVVLIASVAVLYFFNPSQHGFYPICVFYKTTGLLCPGCGTLRAMHQLLHGHIEAAFRFNALIVSSLPLLALGFLQSARYRALNKPAMAWVRPNWLWALLVILIVFGILRNVPGASHYFLAPQ
jgi:Protein of unknown function (DUF2752)